MRQLCQTRIRRHRRDTQDAIANLACSLLEARGMLGWRADLFSESTSSDVRRLRSPAETVLKHAGAIPRLSQDAGSLRWSPSAGRCTRGCARGAAHLAARGARPAPGLRCVCDAEAPRSTRSGPCPVSRVCEGSGRLWRPNPPQPVQSGTKLSTSIPSHHRCPLVVGQDAPCREAPPSERLSGRRSPKTRPV